MSLLIFGFDVSQTVLFFYSDTERILATVLEREARRWFWPVSGQFNIFAALAFINPSTFLTLWWHWIT